MRRLPAALLSFVSFAAVGVACGPAARPPPDTAPRMAPAPPPPEPRADGRLPPLAKPLGYELSFEIDPGQPRFAGKEDLSIELPAPSRYVILHAHGLHVTRAVARAGDALIEAAASARTAAGGKAPEELVLAFTRELPAGRARLHLEWDAPWGDELSGLYRVKDGGLWYAYTQFEATDARRAFPCFDEPAFKVPFTVSVTAPSGLSVFANAPEAGRREGGGRTTFRFAPTQPLPTYLVALAIGDFDVREATRDAKPAIRLIAPKGKAALGGLALEATGALVDGLADWFAIPYPYDKLDIVAVPDFAAGAMENAGLVTFRQELLLLDPARASARIRRSQAYVIAHELAHQWFGNLVTAEWWNDVWLNEGMATWMQARAVQRWRPAWGAEIDAAVDDLHVMDQDALASARAVRQPVVSTSEALESFDGITYQKGAALLRTIERWVGEETFRKAVREYLRASAWKSVHADALLGALDRASGKDVSRMAATFLDKPSVPAVSATLACERGGRFSVELGSEPWRPLGSRAPDDRNRSWIVPVCILAQGEKEPTCTELTEGAPSLIAGRGCPAWVHPNAESSYYRFWLDGADLAKLARAKLDVARRASVLSNAWATVRAGRMKPGALLDALPAFDEDPARQITAEVAGVLSNMSDALVEDDARPAFRTLVAERLGKRKKDLGWEPKKDEAGGGDEAMTRRTVLWAMGELAEDDATLKEAEALAARWLADPASIDADTAGVAVDLGSRRKGEARLAELRAAAKAARTDEDRIVALRAMGSFDDARILEKALELVLGDEIKISDVRHVLGAAFGRRRTRAVADRWVRASWDALRKKLPGSLGGGLVRGAGVACTRADVEDAAAFYGPRAADIEGAARGLAQALEGASLCAELRAASAASLTRALSRAGAR